MGDGGVLNGFEGYIGPLAGLATSVLWTLTAICFTAGGRRIGSTAVNLIRLFVAVVLLGGTYFFRTGGLFPSIPADQLWLLGVSGMLGLTLCDQALFTAFISIGPRRSLLVMTTSPLFALLFGVGFLGEGVSFPAVVGIIVTLSGVMWVVLERVGEEDPSDRTHLLKGLSLALFASVAQAAGAMMSKKGMGHGMDQGVTIDPQAATYVRMTFGAAGMIPIALFARFRGRKTRALKSGETGGNRRLSGLGFTLMGSVVGPYLGVWMSLVAFNLAPIGVAQTLCSLAPVLILPFVPYLDGERVGKRAVLGAVAAVAGTAILFFV